MFENPLLWSLTIYISTLLLLGIIAFFPLPWLGNGPMRVLVEVNLENILLELEQRRLRSILVVCVTLMARSFIPLITDTSYFPFIELVTGLGLLKAFTVLLYPITYKLPDSNNLVVINHKNVSVIATRESTTHVG